MRITHSLVGLSFGLFAALGATRPVAAQVPADSIARFVARAREATRRFQDRAAAIEAGYRRIGPDFPGMGEHWISIGLLFRASFDAAHPAVLEYIDSAGTPRLVGVAYVLPLLPGESPPEFPARHAWHSHTRSVDEESAIIAQMSSVHGDDDASRLAMLHAWIWLDGADSIFVADNWELPFLRLGMEPPRGDIPPAAARALSLAAGGDAFYKWIYERALSSATDSAAITLAVDDARREVEALLAGRDGALGSKIRPDELRALACIWAALWERLERELPAESYRALSEMQHR